jgi:hypothetical protein
MTIRSAKRLTQIALSYLLWAGLLWSTATAALPGPPWGGQLTLTESCTEFVADVPVQQLCIEALEVTWQAYEDGGTPRFEWQTNWQWRSGVRVAGFANTIAIHQLPAAARWSLRQSRPDTGSLFLAQVFDRRRPDIIAAWLLIQPRHYAASGKTSASFPSNHDAWDALFIRPDRLAQLGEFCGAGTKLTPSDYLSPDSSRELFAAGFELSQLRTCKLTVARGILQQALAVNCGVVPRTRECLLQQRQSRQALRQWQRQFDQLLGSERSQESTPLAAKLNATEPFENSPVSLAAQHWQRDQGLQYFQSARQQARRGKSGPAAALQQASRPHSALTDLSAELAWEQRQANQSPLTRYSSSFIRTRLDLADRFLQNPTARDGSKAIAAVEQILVANPDNLKARDYSLKLATHYLRRINQATKAGRLKDAERLVAQLMELNLSADLLEVIVQGLNLRRSPPSPKPADTDKAEQDKLLQQALAKAEQARTQLQRAQRQMASLEQRISQQKTDSADIARLRQELERLRSQGRSEAELGEENRLLAQMLAEREQSLKRLHLQQQDLHQQLANGQRQLNKLDADKQYLQQELQQVNGVLSQFGINRQSIDKFPPIREAVAAEDFERAIKLMADAGLIAPNPGFLEKTMIKQGLKIVAKINRQNEARTTSESGAAR